MATSTTAKRTYHSPVRAHRAAQNRLAILAAAASLFESVGYDGTTKDMIADAAGVSVESVHKVGAKSQLLILAFQIRLTGESGWRSALKLNSTQDLFTITDPEVGLRRVLDWITASNAGSGLLLYTVRSVARTEAPVRDRLATMIEDSAQTFTAMARWMCDIGIVENAPHDEDSLRELSAQISVIVSPETYVQLVHDHRFSKKAYRAWVTTALSRLSDQPPR